MSGKQRISATVDAELLAAAEAAAASGQVPTVSAWVNEALRLKVEHDRRLLALAAFIESFEAEHGEITHAEMTRAAREAAGRAVTVRGPRRERASTRKGRKR